MCAWTTSSMCEVISFMSSRGLTLNATTDLWFLDRKTKNPSTPSHSATESTEELHGGDFSKKTSSQRITCIFQKQNKNYVGWCQMEQVHIRQMTGQVICAINLNNTFKTFRAQHVGSGSGVEPVSCYRKGAGMIPMFCMLKCPWARYRIPKLLLMCW